MRQKEALIQKQIRPINILFPDQAWPPGTVYFSGGHFPPPSDSPPSPSFSHSRLLKADTPFFPRSPPRPPQPIYNPLTLLSLRLSMEAGAAGIGSRARGRRASAAAVDIAASTRPLHPRAVIGSSSSRRASTDFAAMSSSKRGSLSIRGEPDVEVGPIPLPSQSVVCES